MLLIELAQRVHALRLNPYTELDAEALGLLHQRADAVGQFLGVGHPVAQCLCVVRATVLTAEPAVIDHEQLAAQVAYAVHHLFANLLVHIHIDTLP